MSQELRTLHSYWSLDEAHLARVQLESAGIRAFISNEQTLGMAWHLGNALQGAKLQVAEVDLERAAGILEEQIGPETESTWLDEAGDVVCDTQQLTQDEDAEDEGVLANIESVSQPVIWLTIAVVAFAVLGIATAVVQGLYH